MVSLDADLSPLTFDTLHSIVEAQAARNPRATAVEDGAGRSISYADLEAAAARLAIGLLARGLTPRSVVGLLATRSVGLVVAILALLKSGCAFVPLSPKHPDERVAFCLRDAQAWGVIVSASLDFSSSNLEVIQIDDIGNALRPSVLPRPPPSLPTVLPSDVSHIYYTSGSTGTPKGVVCEHQGAVSQIQWFLRLGRAQQGGTVLCVTELTHDPVLVDIFVALGSGARLLLASERAQRDGVLLHELLRAQRVTLLQATPSTFELLRFGGWEGDAHVHVFSGGERPPIGLKSVFARCASFTNVYGPTETTIWATAHSVEPAEWDLIEEVPIGKPIANMAALVLDPELRSVPPGCVGELCLCGVGVSRGYLNRPEKTAAAFVENPNPHLAERFAAAGFPRSSLLYRTGDLASLDAADGALRMHGRSDNQVKIRGERIELGEVERVLEQHGGVRRCVVLARRDAPSYAPAPVLCAYLEPSLPVTAPTQRTLKDSVAAFAAAKMPSCQVPRFWEFVEEWPLAPTAKLDRSALPLPRSATERRAPPAARARVDEESLGSATLGEVIYTAQLTTGAAVTESSTLLGIGIDSISAVVFVRTLSRRVGVACAARDLRAYPTVGALAAALAVRRQQQHAATAGEAERTPEQRLVVASI